MEQEIRRYLGQTTLIGQEIRCFDVIGSTNTYLKCAALEGAADGTVVIARHQTAGRGRLSRSFESPEGKGLYFSVLLLFRVLALIALKLPGMHYSKLFTYSNLFLYF